MGQTLLNISYGEAEYFMTWNVSILTHTHTQKKLLDSLVCCFCQYWFTVPSQKLYPFLILSEGAHERVVGLVLCA